MRNEHKSIKWLGIMLTALLMVEILLVGAANVAKAQGVNSNETTDISQIKYEFEMGNLLLFSNGDNEASDDGEIDDSVYLGEGEEADLGDEGEDGGEIDDTPAAITVGRVVGSAVKLRETAEANGVSVAELNEGATVTIIERKGNWYRISFGILEGYVHRDYLFEVSEGGLNGTILRDGVNIREAANLESAVVGTLSTGNGVQVIDYLNGWYEISFGGKTGYVRNDCISVSGAFTGETNTRMLKQGMSGDAVKKAQTELNKRGFFSGTITGDYGPKTTQAVKDFQRAAKLGADGVLGEQSLAVLYGNNNIKVTIATASQVKGKVQMTEWTKVNTMIPRGKNFKIIDVRTGVSWNEKRRGGYLHIDCEPLTLADTKKLKSVFGGSWTWNRRAVWVVYGNTVLAASMNGMPHGGGEVTGNDFDGHHCVHFYKSQTHCSKKQCPKHQAMVLAAYQAGK